jgi:hypothetical protein
MAGSPVRTRFRLFVTISVCTVLSQCAPATPEEIHRTDVSVVELQILDNLPFLNTLVIVPRDGSPLPISGLDRDEVSKIRELFRGAEERVHVRGVEGEERIRAILAEPNVAIRFGDLGDNERSLVLSQGFPDGLRHLEDGMDIIVERKRLLQAAAVLISHNGEHRGCYVPMTSIDNSWDVPMVTLVGDQVAEGRIHRKCANIRAYNSAGPDRALGGYSNRTPFLVVVPWYDTEGFEVCYATDEEIDAIAALLPRHEFRSRLGDN